MTRRSALLAVVIGAAAAACRNPAGPQVLIEPIHVESVDVAILKSFPAQAVAHVRGVVGDGCAQLEGVSQVRDGNVVTITITRSRPADAVCTQIALLYDERIRLDGTYPPGRYVLRVNGIEHHFTT